MIDLEQAMEKAITEHITQISYVRQCPRNIAALAVAQTYAENLRDSRGTSMESYWERMVAIADMMT